jgi:hypothetical protein
MREEVDCGYRNFNKEREKPEHLLVPLVKAWCGRIQSLILALDFEEIELEVRDANTARMLNTGEYHWLRTWI